jgi:hypothetical protein
MKKLALSGLVSLAVLLAVPGRVAAEPVLDISPQLHPNLAAAQRLSREAFDKISAAQAANHFDMDGHAAKAKALLDQVNVELKLAAEAANRHAKR